MRAMTVRQPWAWAIIHGGKDVENRSRDLAGSYRGPVAIHAGLTNAITDDDIDESALSVLHAWRHWWQANGMPGGQRGHIIGVVDLVAVHHADRDAIACALLGRSDNWCSPWAEPGAHHLVLATPRPLPEPVRATGRLGLWTLPADVEADVLRQVTP